MLKASTALNKVSIKYKQVIVDGITIASKPASNSLLDLDGIDLQISTEPIPPPTTENNKEIDVLCDVFSSNDISEQPSTAANDFLLPMVVCNNREEITTSQLENNKTEKLTNGNKSKALEELDVLSEHLLKENLQASNKKLDQQFNKYVVLNFLLCEIFIKTIL